MQLSHLFPDKNEIHDRDSAALFFSPDLYDLKRKELRGYEKKNYFLYQQN